MDGFLILCFMVLSLLMVKLFVDPQLSLWVVFAPFWVIAGYVFLSGIVAIFYLFINRGEKKQDKE